jgi:hypothetical protein
MNKDQRKYLADHVIQTYNTQVEVLKDSIPEKPVINNYLIGEILTGTVKMKSNDLILKYITDRANSLESDKNLVEKEETSYRRGRWTNKVTMEEYIKIEITALFEIPQSYTEAYDKYLKIKTEAEEKIAKLEAIKNTILLKVNVGSDKSLIALVDQIDNVADLNLMNDTLVLQASTEQKTLTDGSKES